MNENLQFILLNAGAAHHHADWNWKNISSPFARLFLPIKGSASIIIGKTKTELSPDALYLIPPFVLHGYECDDDFSLYYFHIYENLSSNVRILEEHSFPLEMTASALDKELIARLLETNPNMKLQRPDPSFYDNNPTLIDHIKRNLATPYFASLETNGIISQLLSRFIQHAAPRYDISDDRIVKTIAHIRKNIDHEITIDHLAQMCFLSKDHFIRLFRKEMNTTPMQYINQSKIEKVQLLLISTDSSIKSIANRLSFNNLSNFNRLFRHFTGMTPDCYRKNLTSL